MIDPVDAVAWTLRLRSRSPPAARQNVGDLWRRAAACGVGVAVAAAVALPLADAIGDAPVNVAGVGVANTHMNSYAPDFCRTTGVRNNEMTMTH